jgi:Fanconi anemia group I protein
LTFLQDFDLETAKVLLRIATPLAFEDECVMCDLSLLLRKSIFSKLIEIRMMALYGYRGLLLFQENIGSSSQGSTITPRQVEVLGIIKRCLGQSAEIRAEFYRILQGVCRERGELVPCVLDILVEHGKGFFEEETGVLHLPSCFVAEGVDGMLYMV